MSLMRFRCVSKFFDALVLDSDFTHVHHLRFMTREGGTKFLMGKTENLYAKHDKELVRIFNPNTRKMVVLPYQRKYSRSVESSYYYSLGYEPVEKTYKVLMQVDNLCGHVRNFIFTLRIDKSWRKIKGIFDFLPSFSIKTCSIEGVIYMMDYLKKSIVAFDLRIENFRVIGLDFIEVKRKIALLDCWGCFTGQNDLWILENSEKEEWKSHGIHIPSQWKDVEDISKPKYCPPQGFYDSCNGEIIFITMKNSILFCNFYEVEKNSWRHLKIHGAPTEDGIYDINFYIENLYLC
ncbi:hypothetical protein R3W88_008132 [Solanum pinnatisectum]|uniref:F-box associated beta-propeller type 3 domain-containing protein n=1 Tax=Solanum pinnatisectum TaxID=50273 RepID=A0AAV9M745_9SOLN|nr:hypothetical protein R3W88_008132 [Solanum pinnatisectum]